MKIKKTLLSLFLSAAMILGTACSQTPDASDIPETSDASVSDFADETAENGETETDETSDNITTASAEETEPAETSDESTETESEPTTENETDAAETVQETVAEETASTAVETEASATTTTTTVAAATTTAATTTTTTAAATTAAAQTVTDGKTVKIDALNLPSNVEALVNAMGAGWNLGNQLEASLSGVPSETAWGNPVITESLIKAVKAQGFKTVRIPVSYLLKIGDGPDYKIDEQWLNRVKEVVDYVINNDMYAIINIHGDGYYTVDKGWLLCVEDDAQQAVIKEKYRAVWKQIAECFKDYSDHLIFESMNEVFDDTYGDFKPKGYENINDYNQIFVDTVRATGSNNANRWLLIPGWNTNIDATVNSAFKLPSDSAAQKIIVSVHYYDPYEFALNTDSTIYKWGNDATKGKKTNWGHEDYLDGQMQKLYNTFTSKGIPVIIGEFGAIDKRWSDEASADYRRYFFEYLANSAVNHGCIPVYWDNGYDGKNGFSLFDRKNAAVLYPELTGAIVRGAVRGSYDIAVPPAV